MPNFYKQKNRHLQEKNIYYELKVNTEKQKKFSVGQAVSLTLISCFTGKIPIPSFREIK